MAMKSIFSRKSNNVDYAAIALFAVAVVLIIALIVQFFLWVKVRYEHRAAVAEWKGVIDVATEKAGRAEKACATLEAAATEARTNLEARVAEISGRVKTIELAQTALEESFAHFNAKTIAREREQAKAAKREGRAGRATGGYGEQGAAAESDDDTGQGDILAALAEQARATEARAGQSRAAANGQGVPGSRSRLVPKRFG